MRTVNIGVLGSMSSEKNAEHIGVAIAQEGAGMAGNATSSLAWKVATGVRKQKGGNALGFSLLPTSGGYVGTGHNDSPFTTVFMGEGDINISVLEYSDALIIPNARKRTCEQIFAMYDKIPENFIVGVLTKTLRPIIYDLRSIGVVLVVKDSPETLVKEIIKQVAFHAHLRSSGGIEAQRP